MSERKLLFMMNAEQTETFARLLGAAERGDGSAACRLGDMYREGLGGLRYSPKEARRWYATSALTGDADGQCNLGACYEHGLGCTQSYVKAVKWYRLSDAQGHGTASMNLGYCTLSGHGVPANRVEALRLFRLAVERGEPRAAEELERLGEPEEEVQAPEKRTVRIVHETESRKHFGVVGMGEVTEEERVSAAASEKWRDLNLRAWTKDDCFGIPEPGDSDYESHQAYMRRFYRRHAAGVIPDLKGEPTLVWTPALEASFFDLYAHEGITPEEVASERRERYREFLEKRERAGVSESPAVEATEDELFPIYAESGMNPADFVNDTAERYAEFLGSREDRQA